MGNAFVLIVIGLLLFYVVLSDKFYCIEGCAACLLGEYQPANSTTTQPTTAPVAPTGNSFNLQSFNNTSLPITRANLFSI